MTACTSADSVTISEAGDRPSEPVVENFLEPWLPENDELPVHGVITMEVSFWGDSSVADRPNTEVFDLMYDWMQFRGPAQGDRSERSTFPSV